MQRYYKSSDSLANCDPSLVHAHDFSAMNNVSSSEKKSAMGGAVPAIVDTVSSSPILRNDHGKLDAELKELRAQSTALLINYLDDLDKIMATTEDEDPDRIEAFMQRRMVKNILAERQNELVNVVQDDGISEVDSKDDRESKDEVDDASKVDNETTATLVDQYTLAATTTSILMRLSNVSGSSPRTTSLPTQPTPPLLADLLANVNPSRGGIIQGETPGVSVDFDVKYGDRSPTPSDEEENLLDMTPPSPDSPRGRPRSISL